MEEYHLVWSHRSALILSFLKGPFNANFLFIYHVGYDSLSEMKS